MKVHKTVLLVISTLGKCGPVNVLKGIVANLDRGKFRGIIATLSPEPSDSCLEEFRFSGVPVLQLQLGRASSFALGAQQLREVAQQIGADLVHCHGIRADIIASRAKLQCRLVSTLHCDLTHDYKLAYGQVIGRVMAVREYAALRHFDAVVGVSESVADASGMSGVRARVIPNGIDLCVYTPPRGLLEVKALRARFGWAQNGTVVLHTGVLIPRKNPVSLVKAFRESKLSEHGQLVFAGDGPLLRNCQREAAGASNVIFLGKRNDVADLLRAADVLVSNSESEGLPMALLEGCATGIQILATDIAPHRKVKQLFPDHVRLFRIGDMRDLATELDSLHACRRGQLAQPVPTALEMISDRRMSTLYQNLYSELLEGRLPKQVV